MKIYDISVPISPATVTWPGDPEISFQKHASIQDGYSCNVTKISLGVHSGTHIDAPFHFLIDGKTVDSIPLDQLIGPCMVIEFNNIEIITKKNLEPYDFSGHKKILLKTSNSAAWENPSHQFIYNFISISSCAADYLVQKGITLIGIDYLSIEGFYSEENHNVHKTLLQNSIVILEGIDLSKIKQGIYELICLPLKLTGIDGAPVRAVLREISS